MVDADFYSGILQWSLIVAYNNESITCIVKFLKLM